MKIIILIHSLSSGGAERVAASLANYWVKKTHDVILLTIDSEKNDYYRLDKKITRVSLDMANNSNNIFEALMYNILRIKKIRKVLKGNNPNVVVSLMSTSNILLAIASLGLNNILSIGSERIHPPKYPLGKIWEILRKYLYKYLDTVVVLTRESESWFLKYTKAKKVVVIPNVANWKLALTKPMKKPLKDENTKLLIAVGRLVEQKNFKILINIFGKLSVKYPQWKLVILGEGQERKSLEKQILELELITKIELPGAVGNIGEWYEKADIFALTSSFEGFPNALVEAMAYGVASISFDCDTGPRDIIKNNVNGILVPIDDVVLFTKKLDLLMGDSSLRNQFSKKSINIREELSEDKVYSKWDRVLKGYDL